MTEPDWQARAEKAEAERDALALSEARVREAAIKAHDGPKKVQGEQKPHWRGCPGEHLDPWHQNKGPCVCGLWELEEVINTPPTPLVEIAKARKLVCDRLTAAGKIMVPWRLHDDRCLSLDEHPGPCDCDMAPVLAALSRLEALESAYDEAQKKGKG